MRSEHDGNRNGPVPAGQSGDGVTTADRPDLNILIYISPAGERHIFTFHNEKLDDLLLVLGRWASDPDLPGFGWGQAAELGRAAKAMVGVRAGV